MENIAPGIGDNQPDAFEALKARAEALVEMANRWLTEVPEITDEGTAGKCDSFINQLGDECKATEEHRGSEVEPHKEAVSAINELHHELHHKTKMTGLLDVAKNLLKQKRTVWLQKK